MMSADNQDSDCDMKDDDYYNSQITTNGSDEAHCRCPSPKKNCHEPLTNTFNRHSIVQYLHSTKPPQPLSSVYMIRNEKTYRSTKLFLRDAWARTPILKEGTIVNICGTSPDENGHFIVERDQGFVIMEPDRLISVTNVVGMSWCQRKIAFSERFRFPVDNVDTLRGTIAHDLICQAMLKKLKTLEDIQNEMNTVLSHPDVREKAYSLGMSDQELEKLGHELVLWTLSFTAHRMISKQCSQKWEILNVRDIEDCYWSPEFGLKGKVDCTVEAKNEFGQVSVIPVEFKTGNPRFAGRSTTRMEHLGQVYLYTLLMRSERDNFVGADGILHYIREDHLVECTAPLRDLQALVMARNQILLNTSSDGSDKAFSMLPRPTGVDFDRQCQRCEYRNICALSLRTSNDMSNTKNTDTERKLLSSIGHLSQEEIACLDKWLQIINFEADEDEMGNNSKDLWLKSVSQREKEGKCIGDLKLSHQTQDNQITTAFITFSLPQSKQLLTINFSEKDFVIIGTLEDPCIGFAVVEAIQPGAITVSVERLITGRHCKPGIKFTLNKVSSNGPGMVQFVYLSKLMEDSPTANRLRQYLILKKPPSFGKMSTKEIMAAEKSILLKYNKPQRVAMMKSITTDSFLLIKGSPGCGKTTTIVGLIRMLVLRKKSVLVSAYTNNALDNILLSYRKYDRNFIRIGSGGRLNQKELGEHSTEFTRSRTSTVDQLAEVYNSTPVVGTTLLSLKHPIFTVRKFDYCIIDEGSQALPTVIIGALLQAEKCIIFGDPNQLPATIKSRKIKNMKIADNLFSMFPEPEFCCSLSIQYRMNQFIMKLANELLYGNQMQCGTEHQAQGCLELSADVVKQYLLEKIPRDKTRKWLCLAASKRPERSVMYFDTACIGAFEKLVSSTLYNIKEKDIGCAIAQMLVQCGTPVEEIGIIAPYRGQVHLIQEQLHSARLEIEVNTVDQYQGREKNVIIVSLTKSVPYIDTNTKVEDSILNDIRRLNVAITRAKAKVILIGNSSTLKIYPACNRLLSLLSENQKYKFSSVDFYSTFFEDYD